MKGLDYYGSDRAVTDLPSTTSVTSPSAPTPGKLPYLTPGMTKGTFPSGKNFCSDFSCNTCQSCWIVSPPRCHSLQLYLNALPVILGLLTTLVPVTAVLEDIL